MNKDQLKSKILKMLDEIIIERDDSMKKDNYENAYYCIGYSHALERIIIYLEDED